MPDFPGCRLAGAYAAFQPAAFVRRHLQHIFSVQCDLLPDNLLLDRFKPKNVPGQTTRFRSVW
jgi:hypothetical protein